MLVEYFIKTSQLQHEIDTVIQKLDDVGINHRAGPYWFQPGISHMRHLRYLTVRYNSYIMYQNLGMALSYIMHWLNVDVDMISILETYKNDIINEIEKKYQTTLSLRQQIYFHSIYNIIVTYLERVAVGREINEIFQTTQMAHNRRMRQQAAEHLNHNNRNANGRQPQQLMPHQSQQPTHQYSDEPIASFSLRGQNVVPPLHNTPDSSDDEDEHLRHSNQSTQSTQGPIYPSTQQPTNQTLTNQPTATQGSNQTPQPTQAPNPEITDADSDTSDNSDDQQLGTNGQPTMTIDDFIRLATRVSNANSQ